MASKGGTNMDILSDEVFDFMCRVCKRKGKNCEAEKYCEQCCDYFCLICVKVHDDIPSLTGHTILEKEQFPNEPVERDQSSTAKSDTPTERCARHSHHFIDMYCQSHDEVGCGTCMAMDHRLCKDTFYIPEYVENKRRITRSCDMEQKLKEVANSLTEHLENFKQEREKLLKSKEAMLELVHRFRKEINDRLDELEKTTVTDIADKYASFVDIIDKGMTMFETSKDKVNKSLEVLLKDNESVTQKFVNIKKSKHLASETTDFIKENKQSTSSQDIDFSADNRVLSLLNEMTTLGKTLQQAKSRSEHIPRQDKTQEVSKENQVTPSKIPDMPIEEALHQTKEIKKYWINVRTDKFECSILTACSMNDGTIILAEGRNNKLKRLNGFTFALRDFCDMPGKPWQVCAINNDQVAVTLPRKEKVLVVSLSNKMTIIHQIATGFNCHGLAYTNGNLYISDRFTAVFVYNFVNEKMQKFTKGSPSRDMCYAIRSLAVTEDGSKVFAVGWNNGLIVLDKEGKVVGRFNEPLLDGAWDCHLTGAGSLLVSGNNSNNVLQFGLDGKLKGEVVRFTDKNGSYKGLCCNRQMTKMIIGKTGDQIEVYDLV